MNIFDKEMKDCTTEYNACSDACMKEGEKPDGTAYFNAGEIYPKCMKASQCHEKSSSCSEQALTNYRACGKPGNQSEPVEAKKEIPKQEGKLSTQAISDWIMENELISDPARLEQMEREKLDLELYRRTPQMTEEIVKKAQEEWKKSTEPVEVKPAAPFRARADFLKGDADIKYPGTDKWVPLKTGDIIPPGATLFTGMDATLVLSLQDKGVFQMLPFTEIVVSEENIKRASHTDIKLNTGDIEVSIEGGVYTGTLQVQTPSVVAGVRGTHFWVSYDKDKRLSVTGVYEGKVEVTPRGSNKSVTISPNGDKPGVAVVTQKLSVTKLAVLGLVLAVVVGGIAWFVKRKKRR